MTLSMLRPRPIAQRFHRAPTPQERGDELLMQWRLARAAGIPATNRLDREGPAMPRELHPIDVLADLLGSGDFPVEIADPDAAAKLILERLNDAGFKIVPAAREDRT